MTCYGQKDHMRTKEVYIWCLIEREKCRGGFCYKNHMLPQM